MVPVPVDRGARTRIMRPRSARLEEDDDGGRGV